MMRLDVDLWVGPGRVQWTSASIQQVSRSLAETQTRSFLCEMFRGDGGECEVSCTADRNDLITVLIDSLTATSNSPT